jgi:hypothetical protein
MVRPGCPSEPPDWLVPPSGEVWVGEVCVAVLVPAPPCGPDEFAPEPVDRVVVDDPLRLDVVPEENPPLELPVEPALVPAPAEPPLPPVCADAPSIPRSSRSDDVAARSRCFMDHSMRVELRTAHKFPPPGMAVRV